MESTASDSGDARGPSSLPRASDAFHASADAPPYDATFWFCYAANLSLMVAVSLLFRYADFVRVIGGGPFELGLIVGVGMLGALATRGLQGAAIDRLGARRVWQLALLLFAISMLAHLAVQRVDGVGVYLARMLLMTSTAAAFGSSLTYVSLRAPPGRIGETIGIIGTSGFLGIALGPTLGDWLLAGDVTRPQIARLFVASATLSIVALVCVSRTPRPCPRPKHRPLPLLAVLRRYHPGTILLIAATMGMILGLPHTFLNAYAIELGLPRIKIFFLVYAFSALVVRIRTRRMADLWGVRPVILWGLSSAVLSMVSYLLVRNEWSLAIPAAFAGAAHALLFPAVVAGGNAAFPARYRGLSTTLMLAMSDIGNLIGQPAMGGIVELARRAGLPPYPTLFSALACLLLVIASCYGLVSRRPSKQKPVIVC